MTLIPFALSVREAPAGSSVTAGGQLEIPLADGFDFPVGPPDATGYYNAQGFGRNHHLGEDWNGNGGGNSDMGDPVFAIGAGVVSLAEDLPGNWGNVVRIIHRYEVDGDLHEVESLYAHLLDITVEVGDVVRRGQSIGSIGDADGAFVAHLHLELRDTPGMSIGPGYSSETHGYLSPSVFISEHR